MLQGEVEFELFVCVIVYMCVRVCVCGEMLHFSGRFRSSSAQILGVFASQTVLEVLATKNLKLRALDIGHSECGVAWLQIREPVSDGSLETRRKRQVFRHPDALACDTFLFSS